MEHTVTYGSKMLRKKAGIFIRSSPKTDALKKK